METLEHEKVENLKEELTELEGNERAWKCLRACLEDEALGRAVLNDPSLRELRWGVPDDMRTVAHTLSVACEDVALRALEMPDVRRLRADGGRTVAHAGAGEHESVALKALGMPAVRNLKDKRGSTVAHTAVLFHSSVAIAALDMPAVRTLRDNDGLTVAHTCVLFHRGAALKALEMPVVTYLTDQGCLADTTKGGKSLQSWHSGGPTMTSGRSSRGRTVAGAGAIAHPVACIWGNILGVVHARTGFLGLSWSAVEAARDRHEFGSLCRALAEESADAVLDLLEHTSFAARLDTAGWAALLAAENLELRAEAQRRVAERRCSARRAS